MSEALRIRRRIVKDGNAWCAIGPSFSEGLVAEAFGCGATPKAAYESWLNDANRRLQWRSAQLPSFDDFVIE